MTRSPRKGSDSGDLRLVHHHVGGRAGDTPFGFPEIFEQGVIRVLYDADAGSTEHAQARSDERGRTVITRPYFIGRPGVRKPFKINFCPYTSSTRHLDPRFAGFFVEVFGTDYVLGEVTQPTRTIEIESHGLDELVRKEGENLPAPDLLSLDVEGGEDDILAGARDLLDDRVLAVTTEVVFNRIFSDGPVYGEIAATLFAHGFLFIEFEGLSRYAPMRGRLGTRGRGLITAGDASFYKDPTKIRARTEAERALMLRKLAFVALCRAQLEFAQHCLAMLPQGEGLPTDAPAYLRFVDQFQRLCAVAPDVMPWRFNEAYTPEYSAARFRVGIPEEEQGRIAGEIRELTAREAMKIERLKGELSRAAGALPMVQHFKNYGLDYVAAIILDIQKDQVERYLTSVMARVSELNRGDGGSV
jgi:FkbM family methyltransferase